MAEFKFGDGIDVNTKKGDRKVWLVKLPRHVAEAWASAETGADLGKVRMEIPTSTPNAPPNMVLCTNTKAGPVDFQMSFAKDALNMMSFAVAPDQVQVVGTVEHKCDLRPKSFDASYARSFQSRSDTGPKVPLLKTQTKGRAFLAQQHTVTNEYKRARVEVNDRDKDKRERMAPDSLMDMLFAAFARQPQWTLRDLVNETDQPLVFLKEVLGGIAVLNKRGPAKGLYELKPEYAGAAPAEQAPSTS